MKNKKIFKIPLYSFWLISLVIFVAVVIGFGFSLRTSSILNKKIAENNEKNRPAELTISLITAKDCKDCVNLDYFITSLKKENIKIVSKNTYDAESKEAVDLINKYEIKKVPTVIVEGEIDKNPELSKLFQKIGIVKDNGFALTEIGAPYLDLKTAKVRGIAKLTMLTDLSCDKKCYDVTVNKKILASFGYASNDDEVIDISSKKGQQLRKKYNIRYIPTILIQGDVEAYSNIVSIWPKVGSIEKDGTYILRDQVKSMGGGYKDLFLNKIIEPKKPSKPSKK